MAERKAKKPKRGRPAGRDAQATREMIVHSARVLFGVHGYSSTTVRMVAHHAGMSNQAVYYHFSGIEAIYDEVVADIIGRLEIAVHDVLAQPTLRSQIRTYALAMHVLDFDDRSVMAFMIREYLDSQRERRRSRRTGALMKGTEAFFVIMVRSAIERGELAPDTDLRATVGLLSSILWGIGLYAGFVDDPDVMARIADQVDSVIARGLPLAPNPDACSLFEEQLVVLGDVERVVVGVDVADHAVASELRR